MTLRTGHAIAFYVLLRLQVDPTFKLLPCPCFARKCFAFSAKGHYSASQPKVAQRRVTQDLNCFCFARIILLYLCTGYKHILHKKLHKIKMPQLDKVTFLSQFFWLSIFFLAFYIILLKQFLPKMSRILKFRKKRLSFSGEGVLQLGGEKEKVEKSYSTLVGNGLSLPRNVLSVNFKKIESWLKDTLSQTNQTKLGQVNKRYIASLGERAVAQNLPLIPVYTLPLASHTQEGQNDSSSSLSFFLLKSLVSAQKQIVRSLDSKRKSSQPVTVQRVTNKAESVRTESTTPLSQNKETVKGKKSKDGKDKQAGKDKKKGKSKS